MIIKQLEAQIKLLKTIKQTMGGTAFWDYSPAVGHRAKSPREILNGVISELEGILIREISIVAEVKRSL